MATDYEIRPNWLPIVLTSAVTLVLPLLFGWSNGWIAAVSLLPLVIAAWLLDPLILAATVVAVTLAASVTWHWLPVSPIPVDEPLMIWLTIAIIHLVRNELNVRMMLLDKTAKLQAERKEQQELRTFFENSPAAMLTADGVGKIITANPAARKLLGFEDRPLQGQGIAPSLTALGAALRIDRKSRLLHTLTGCTGWRPNGEMFVADAWFSIVETPFGTRLGAVVVDASERLQERARGGLRSSMATSQIAMSAILHEIRNMSAAAAFMYTNLADNDAVHLSGLQENADFEALGVLLKALANLAATELRPGTGSHSSVDLAAALAQLRIIVGPWFLESEINILWDIPAELPHVFGEESGLLQIFLNLAQNSHKAMLGCELRQLTVRARVEREWVVVEFRDTGPGIANPEDLFEPFRQSTGIKGLGLFVSRAIAHSLYGELKYVPVHSGSCFVVELLPLREWQKVTVEYQRNNREN
jgi:two-component system sensor kinase FixL